MSSTLTACSELLPVRQLHAVLPPSVMPVSRSIAAPAVTALKDDKFENAAVVGSKLDALKTRSRAPDGIGAKAVADPRTILGRVNLNVGSATATSQKRPAGRVSTAKAIPRPAPTPDVFAPEPTRATATGTSLGKRARDATPTGSLSKRQRAEATALAARSHREEQDRWLQKWQKVFPTLVFHFEIGADEGPGRGLRQRVLKMGAKIDQFFSHRVSHLIVKNIGSPQKTNPSRKGTYAGGASDNPFLDKTGVTDLVEKAKALNIKVWTVKKLADMVNKLAPLDTNAGDSLSHLLADEKLNGTRERDLSAPRPDFYYFKPGNKYLLVEDATGRNRSVMVKEYPAKERAWPVLHDHFLRLTSSSQLPSSVQNSHNLLKDIRARAVALFVDQVPFRGELPPPRIEPRSTPAVADVPPLTPLPDIPYEKASGNSVVITSAIASTSTANLTPNGFVNGVPQLGANKDRAIMQMSKRVQVLKGNARMAASVSAKKSGGSENRVPESTPSGGQNPRRRSTGSDAAPAPPKEFLTQDQVVAMLQQLREPTNLSEPSYEERVANREQVLAGYKRKDQDTASGYCENCRVRYTDLSVHIASRKHRRFASSEKNFEDLDAMLECLQRPPNPLLCAKPKVCRPCTKPHLQTALCGKCLDDASLFSSPPASMAGSSPARKSSAGSLSPSSHGAFDDGGSENENGNGLDAIEEEDEHVDEQWEEGDRTLDA